MTDNNKLGRIGWVDLTVGPAVQVRDFYQAVVGFDVLPIDMGGYEDFCLLPPGGGDPVAGVCHARGSNAEIPPVWLVYFTVSDVAAAARTTEDRGGRILIAPRPLSGGQFAVIADPAGAVCALFQPPA
ncbi:MAG: VOC family protein [Planctomycetaceae bacterium]|nr:VOC family protein [Planctomycetaceae bacterium]